MVKARSAMGVLLWMMILTAVPLTGPRNASGTDPIRLGGSLSLQGRFQEPSAMIAAGYRLWVRDVNERGGLLGRPVELVLYDDRSREDLVRAHYRTLLEDDRVDLILSPYGSPLTLAASEISESHRRVMMACAAASETLWDRRYRYLFGIYATAERYFIGLLDLMARCGLKTVAIVHEDGAFHRDVADGVAKWAARFHLDVSLRHIVRDIDRDVPAAVAALATRDPAAGGVVVSAYPGGCYRFLDACRHAGYRPGVLGMTIAPVHPDFIQRAGAMAEGVFAPSQWEPDERIPFPGTREFVERFNRLHGTLPSYHAGSAYAACQVLEWAVTRTGGLDHDELRDLIASLDTVTVIGRFKVDDRGMQIGHNPILIQWQDGRKQIVYPTKMQTAPARFPSPAP